MRALYRRSEHKKVSAERTDRTGDLRRRELRGARFCHYEWVKQLRDECEEYNVTFAFIGTGRRFVKDSKIYQIEGSELQANQAYKSGLSYKGKPMDFKLCNLLGMPISDERRYKPYYGDKCQTCGMKIICNGCTHCGKCEQSK